MNKGSILHILEHSVEHTIMIASFVFVMMLIIEYVNIQTKGLWHKNLDKSKWRQYLLAALLGVLPGCLGSFTSVALFSHGILSFGALVTTMIATAGDESFIMLGMIPKTVLILFPMLVIIAIFAGWFVDKFFNFSKGNRKFVLHKEIDCNCLNLNNIKNQIKQLSLQRGVLILLVILILSKILMGGHEMETWNWMRITFLILDLISLFIVVTVPEHFLEEHLWGHIVKRHLPQIVGWTFGAILISHFLIDHLNVGPWMESNLFLILIIACLVGLIPESGPHLVFLTFFAQGIIPFSVLLASSIVQDGHGMLPLLAESRKKFVLVKLINFGVGLAVGSVALFIESLI